MTTMKAVQIEQFGGVEVLNYKEDVVRPEPETGKVLIQVYAVAVNPVDWKTREGLLQEMAHYPLPLILGWDIAGVVEAIGENVNSINVGDKVHTMPGIRVGGYAEYLVMPAAEVALKPGGILVSTISPPAPTDATQSNIRGEVVVQSNVQQLQQIAELIDTGKVKTFVETVLPLQKAKQAHELI